MLGMKKPSESLLAEIETFLERHGMAATAFGIAAINDGHLVRDLRDGKDLRLSTAARVADFMDSFEPAKGNPPRGNGRRPHEAVAA